jgi:hypothetical protein
MTCLECAMRPYLCFEHTEDARALEVFDGRWRARLAREQAYLDELAKQAFWMGRKVAKGEMLLVKAQETLRHKARQVDETMPIFALIMPLDRAEAIALRAFRAGHRSIQRARRAG